ncbi:hypothetical protein K402DRAFT_253318 [Aulographum hederae CBS 113979]|uniref:Uncharacterized protein n=1 Tax=Aulographum hederae CBS 113979 TaxID=1176131 RepID=A0A6G1GJ42_9PEZI|nr:hypothetical protein K402DRAFT_253318 [Aulographum hederae CBS 113979]
MCIGCNAVESRPTRAEGFRVQAKRKIDFQVCIRHGRRRGEKGAQIKKFVKNLRRRWHRMKLANGTMDIRAIGLPVSLPLLFPPIIVCSVCSPLYLGASLLGTHREKIWLAT